MATPEPPTRANRSTLLIPPPVAIVIVTIAVMVLGIIVGFGAAQRLATPPQALPVPQAFTNVSPLATVNCPDGDQVYYLSSINNTTTPAMQMDGAKQVNGKYRVTSSATFGADGFAPKFTVTVEGKVPIDGLYVYNNTDSAPTTTAARDVVQYVTPPNNTGTLVLEATKRVPFSASTHVLACVPSDATGR